jgi:hypothetical protein
MLFYGTGGLAIVHANETIFGNDADESNFYEGPLSGNSEYLFAHGFGSESGPTGTVSQYGDQNYIQEIGSINIICAGLTINSKAPDADDHHHKALRP